MKKNKHLPFLSVHTVTDGEILSVPYNGHTYHVGETGVNWQDARLYCASALPGSDLVVPNDIEEHDFLWK